MQGLKTNKQKKLCPAINSICCCVGRWQTRIKNLLNFAYEKKKKKLYRCTKFSMSRSSWTKMKR